MSDPHVLAERAVTSVMSLLRRGATLVSGVLIVAICASTICLALASAALSGSARFVGLILAVGFALIAVGAAGLARWRLGRVTTRTNDLIREVAMLLDRDHSARETIIETVETQPSTGTRSVVIWSRQFDTLRTMSSRGEFTNLNTALLAVTTFPGLVALSLLAAFALGGLSFIFAIAWLI